jgi:DNA-binding cell septation regulator SpoVG
MSTVHPMFTNFRVFKKEAAGTKVRGDGTFTVGGVLEVRFVVIEGPKGLFLSLPSERWKGKDGGLKYSWRAKIIDVEMFRDVEKHIIERLSTAKFWEKKPQENEEAAKEAEIEFPESELPF